MKLGKCILKIAAALAVIGAAAYLVATYWDTLVDLFYQGVSRVKELRAKYCDCVICPSEFEDFDDGGMAE